MMQMHDIRRVAVEASCDTRTVRRYLEGKVTKTGLVFERIAQAIDKLGLKKAAAPAPTSSNGSESANETSSAKRSA